MYRCPKKENGSALTGGLTLAAKAIFNRTKKGYNDKIAVLKDHKKECENELCAKKLQLHISKLEMNRDKELLKIAKTGKNKKDNNDEWS